MRTTYTQKSLKTNGQKLKSRRSSLYVLRAYDFMHRKDNELFCLFWPRTKLHLKLKEN